MKFSNKAYKYLDTLKRNEDCISRNRNDVENYFIKNGIPIFEKIIDFQMEYSGLELTIYKKELSTFIARLFSNQDIVLNAEIDFFKINEEYYFYCGEHLTAQFWFVIKQSGEICIYDNNEKSINVIFSSFEKFIETYAFEDLLKRNEKIENPIYYKLLDKSNFDNETKSYTRHFTANDNYNEWISNPELMIYVGKFFDRNEFFVHLFSSENLNWETFIENLKLKKIIE